MALSPEKNKIRFWEKEFLLLKLFGERGILMAFLRDPEIEEVTLNGNNQC